MATRCAKCGFYKKRIKMGGQTVVSCKCKKEENSNDPNRGI